MRYGTVKPELLTEFDLSGGAGRARLLAGPYADQVIGPALVGIPYYNVGICRYHIVGIP